MFDLIHRCNGSMTFGHVYGKVEQFAPIGAQRVL